MRMTQLRQADLNLLVVFAVLAEERNVSRAASRLFLSQPAVSRALQRLRGMFHDDLLVRTASAYHPTPQGQRVLRELEVMLPRLDRLLIGAKFNPAEEAATFRIAATDYACQVLCPVLSHKLLLTVGKVSFDFVTRHDQTFEDLERGRLDMALSADDGQIPALFRSEVIYEDELACVIARTSEYHGKLTLKQYLEAPHIVAALQGERETVVEKQLAAIGRKRRAAMRVPYIAAAIRSIAGTNLIATVPKRAAEAEAHNPEVKILQPPAEIRGFKYVMVWHSRLHADAAHTWLRETIRSAGKMVSRP
jgi:DNA-binding transcriptional LysR family regulator